MEKLKPAKELDLKIESLAFGGRGVARLDGFVIFVEGALPGDLVRARVTRSKRSHAEARTVRVLDSSRARVEPVCRHFDICGGCAWQTLAYETQLEFKQSQVAECLAHIGGLSDVENDMPLAAARLWRYRNKVEFSFADDGYGPALGFHLPGQWRRVFNVEDCLLHSQLTNQIRNHVREFVRSSGAGVYDQGSGSGFWRHLVLREAIHTGEVMVNVVTAPGRFPNRERFAGELLTAFPQVKSLLWSLNGTRASVATGFPFEVLAGRDHINEEICGLMLKVSPASFLQTNTLMAERLYGKMLDYAGPAAGGLAFDLYSGVGSIALLLAGRCRRAFGIEIGEEATRLAAENARVNGLENAFFKAGKVRNLLKQVIEETASGEEAPPDLVVLDPPRAGASKKEIERIIKLGASRIVYVSCNAATMAANAAVLAEGGYRLTRAGAVDMFPNTPHIEAVARFDRTRMPACRETRSGNANGRIPPACGK